MRGHAAREEAPDLRLVPLALAAWAGAALALGTTGRAALVGIAASVAAAAVLLLRARGARRPSMAGPPAGLSTLGGRAPGQDLAGRRTRSPGSCSEDANLANRYGPGRRSPAHPPPTPERSSPSALAPASPAHARSLPRPKAPVLLTAAAALLCAATGAAVAALHAADLRRGPVPRLAEQHASATVELTVDEDPRRSRPRVLGSQQLPDALLFRAEVTHVTSRSRPVDANGRAGPVDRAVRAPVLVVAQQREGAQSASWQRLLPSTGLKAEARLTAPLRKGYGQDIAAVVRLRADGRPPVVREPTALQRGAGVLRAGLREATAGLGGDARGLLPGLVVGDTSRLRPDLEEAFRATDMTHLLAVSGANLVIILAVLIGPPGTAHLAERRGLAPRLGIPLRGTAVLGALLTLAFVVVCRSEPSVMRAAACGLIALLALVTGRRRSLLPALAAAVLLLVLTDPWLALDFGFLLSVLATGALLTLAPRWSAALRRRGVNGRLAEALAAAMAAQVVCAPVVVVLASHVSLVAVPCNLLAEFAVAPATVLGFAVLTVAPFAMPLAKCLAWLASWPAEAIAWLARTGAGLPGAEIGWPGGWTGALLLAALTAAVLLLAGATRLTSLLGRPWLSAAFAVLLLLAVVRPVPLVRPLTGWPPPDWRLVACDVGQGDALALATGRAHTAVVVDAGPDPQAVDRCLRALGVDSVPLLVLTHFHADHVAGLPGVLKGRNVGAIQTTTLQEPPGQAEFVRRTARRAGVPVTAAMAGERRRTGELSWQALWPGVSGPPGETGPGSARGAASDSGSTGDAGSTGLPQSQGPPRSQGPGVIGTGGRPEGANDASVTLLFHTGGLSLLLPGDLEPDAQSGLLSAYPALPQVDVLKVAHHGSAYQDPRLLERLRPRIALISCGADNPYGHPAPRTVTALSASGAVVRRTDRDGALAVTGGTHPRTGPGGRPAVDDPTVVSERPAPMGPASGEPP
ncbi:ComEC/Rec2 family competence protein [Streptomyces sp. M600PL45_2]|uniref:ComEC/Rec2 family competence protein n=1 Tax=Streptomyces marispadix TaxID=2922868 RepID=A0ABS9SVD6_9ACTN|nr:ComEC/Rec2 family competence protein [Streptomyces marispadix]